MKDLCTNYTHHQTLVDDDKELTRRFQKKNQSSLLTIYTNLANSAQTKRFTPQAVTQLIHYSTRAIDIETALLNAFKGTKQTLKLTKKEYKLAKLCYKFGQAELSNDVVNSLFYNEKIANNMKLLSQIKNYINDSTDQAQSTAAALNINLTSKEQKIKPNNETETKTKTKIKTQPAQPLKLVADN